MPHQQDERAAITERVESLRRERGRAAVLFERSVAGKRSLPEKGGAAGVRGRPGAAPPFPPQLFRFARAPLKRPRRHGHPRGGCQKPSTHAPWCGIDADFGRVRSHERARLGGRRKQEARSPLASRQHRSARPTRNASPQRPVGPELSRRPVLSPVRLSRCLCSATPGHSAMSVEWTRRLRWWA